MKRRRNSDSNVSSSRESIKRAMFLDDDPPSSNNTNSNTHSTLHASQLQSDGVIAPATQWAHDTTTNNNNTSLNNKKKPSLFGTVMQNVKLSPCQTPQKQAGVVLLNSLNSPFVSTPFVGTPGSVSATSNHNDWHEESFEDWSWDWTVKEKVSLEWHPAAALQQQHAASFQAYPVFATKQQASNDPWINVHASLLQYTFEATTTDDKEGWRRSFQSLFRIWLDAVQKQQQEGGIFDPNTYFYSIAKGCTVLFRASRLQSDEIVPEIVLSSCTAYWRQTLRQCGVALYLLQGWNGMSGEFTEELLRPNKNKTTSSPDVKSELKQLRQAQIVGADISVLDVTSPTKFPTSTIPPLCCRGIDDCLAFFEVYFNCTGSLKRSERSDLPFLLSRFSPFLNCTVQSLDMTTTNANTLQVSGRILPCALRQLLRSCVEVLQQHAKEHPVEEDAHDDNDDVGSHHLVVRSTILENELSGLNCIGNPSSRGFNDETPNIIIWDSNRPTRVAIQTGEAGKLLGAN